MIHALALCKVIPEETWVCVFVCVLFFFFFNKEERLFSKKKQSMPLCVLKEYGRETI